jgi:cytochrome d ubiquinol oxidase subunit II
MGTLWFCIVAAMLAAYVVLDGFDLGVGIVYLFVARTDQDRRTALQAIGPVWDGNEVWLIAAGGTLFFAFPLLYASAFSGFYLPLMIVLWLLILRGVSIELRSHSGDPLWRSFFDVIFSLSSTLLAIFFGAALGNVIRGVPLGADNYFFLPLWTDWRTGPHPGILDCYTVVGAILAVCALGLHGALYLVLKTDGPLEQKSATACKRIWPAVLAVTIISLPATVIARPDSFHNYTHHPLCFIVPAVVIAALIAIHSAISKRRERAGFLCSCLYLTAMLAGAAVGLFPALLPAVGGGQDITIALSLAGAHTLHVGIIWWSFGILLAVMYFVITYWLFRGKVSEHAEGYGH